MKFIYPIILALVCLMGATYGQDWAKERLEKSPRHLEWVKLKSEGRDLNCFVAYPEVKDKAAAVLIIHEIFGLTDWVRGLADQLAEAGYIAIAPDLLSGTAPGGGGTTELGGNDAVRKAIQSMPPDQITSDLKAAMNYVSKLPAANGHVTVAGFCWGGGQSFRFATSEKDLKAALVFYGPPPGKEDMEKINCPVYGFYGENDARINATIPKTKEMMKGTGKKYEPVIYDGAGHGFMRAGEAPDANPANKKARDEAWDRVMKILKPTR
jgi:carboxymethylenebutenolidase